MQYDKLLHLLILTFSNRLSHGTGAVNFMAMAACRAALYALHTEPEVNRLIYA